MQMKEISENEQICEDAYLNERVKSILIHSIIVSNLAYRVAEELGYGAEKRYELAKAGILHDIGKIHLEFNLRHKEESNRANLNAEEIQYVRNHSIDSFNALKKRGCSEYILDSVLYHHENYDGTGYPEGLNGNDIPEGARILRVCDVFAALIDRRSYREALDIDAAVETMIDEVKNYDMKIFLAFQRVIHYGNMEELFDWVVKQNQEKAQKHHSRNKRIRRKRNATNKKAGERNEGYTAGGDGNTQLRYAGYKRNI